MIYTPLTKKAMILAFEKHKNQVDKSGIPYIYHPIHVAEQMTDEVSTVVALLHDTLEDTNTTKEELLNLGFSSDIVEAIQLLTKPEDMDYLEYVKLVSDNDIARNVKIADLKHNSDLSRLDDIKEKDKIRVEKYKKALDILKLIDNS